MRYLVGIDGGGSSLTPNPSPKGRGGVTYLVGIDGGGSKTAALLAGPDGAILGRGSAGSSNHRAVGLERACAALDRALRAAFADAGLEPDPGRVRMACIGLAGVGRPGDPLPFQAWAARRWPGMPVQFVSDARLVLAAGTPAGWGVAAIAGTGSIACGRGPDGGEARAGGWGYLLGDEGSGYHIGLAALRAVVRAADGRGPQTALAGLILEAWGLGSASDLVGRVYRPRHSNAEIAALAGLVERAAAGGDPVARDILTKAGDELALAVDVVAGRLGLSGPVPCALAGGVLVRGEWVARSFLVAAARLGRTLAPIQPVTDPALGAIRLAADTLRERISG